MVQKTFPFVFCLRSEEKRVAILLCSSFFEYPLVCAGYIPRSLIAEIEIAVDCKGRVITDPLGNQKSNLAQFICWNEYDITRLVMMGRVKNKYSPLESSR